MILPLLLAVGSSIALPAFPGVIADWVGAVCAPPCSVCHDGSPSAATATTAFVQALGERGLTRSEASLESALDLASADAVDSDADGVTDIEELVDGTDPNPDGVSFCDLPTPRYGCLSSAGRIPSSGGVLVGLLALLGLGLRRRP